MKPSRREIIGSCGTALGLTILGGAAHFVQRWRAVGYPAGDAGVVQGLLRPPGALEESAFLAACIRCYRCQDACVPGAIQFYSERDGALYHTPYVDPARKGCNLCLKCGPACPTGALLPLQDMARADMGSVALQEDRCLSYKARWLRDELFAGAGSHRWRAESDSSNERQGPCGECYMFCPLRERAITLEPGAFLAPIIHTEHCVGCGMCEEACRAVLHGDPAIRVVRTRRVARAQEVAT